MPEFFKRIMFKCSGEYLMGDRGHGIDFKTGLRLGADIKEVVKGGSQVIVQVGGGNIFRGAEGVKHGLNHVVGDHMGMLATVINALALQDLFEQTGVATRVMSAVPMISFCETYIYRRALRHLDKGRVIILAAGLGSPSFTTDTAAAARAAELECDTLLKGSNVDGVYNRDPGQLDLGGVPIKRYSEISYTDVLSKKLSVIDASAIAIARENNIAIVVFSLDTQGSIKAVVDGKAKCTIIRGN